MGIFHNLPFYTYWYKRELHVKNELSFCNNFRHQEARDLTDQSERVFLQNIPLMCWLTQSLYYYLHF